MKGSLEKTDVAQHLCELRRRPSLVAIALARDDHEREIRPWRLRCGPCRELLQIGPDQRVVVEDRRARSPFKLAEEFCQVGADIDHDVGRSQYRPHLSSVLCEEQNAVSAAGGVNWFSHAGSISNLRNARRGAPTGPRRKHKANGIARRIVGHNPSESENAEGTHRFPAH